MKKRVLKVKPMQLMGSLCVIAYAIVLTVPLYFVIMTAFKTEQERIVNPIGLPIKATLDSFVRAWVDGNLLRASMNSIIISVGATALFLINVILISFCLNRIRDTKLGMVLQMAIVATMFIPGTGTVTKLMLRRDLGMYNNLWGEIVNGGIGVMSIATGVFFVTGFLRTIPRALEEAALIDGANDFQLCTRVIVPVIRPVLVTVGIQEFTARWNDLLNAMLVLRDEKLYTIPMALTINFSNEVSVNYATTFAGVVMTCIPIIILFCKGQKYLVSGMAGSVKG